MDKQALERWMIHRVREASQGELVGFIHFPMHPRMVELAVEELERRDGRGKEE